MENIAPLIETLIGEGKEVSPTEITNGVMDYSLKCISGPHKGKFAYINLTPDGEIIGDRDEDGQVTLAVPGANLDPKHAQIIYKSGCYILKDLNSTTGTWHKYGSFKWTPIYDKMRIKLESEEFQFEFGTDVEDPLEQLLRKYGLADGLESMRSNGYTNVESLQSLKLEQVTQLKKMFPPEHEESVEAIAKCFKTDLAPNYLKKKLVIKNIRRNIQYEKDWVTFTIGNLDTSSVFYNCEEEGGHDALSKPGVPLNYMFELIVVYQYGGYWLVNSPQNPVKEFYVRVEPDSENHELRADDVIRVGDLDLRVCRYNIGSLQSKGKSTLLVEKSSIAQDIVISDHFDISMFTLFDGNNNVKCQRVVSDELPQSLKLALQGNDDVKSIDKQTKLFAHLKQTLENTFEQVDQNFLRNQYKLGSSSDYDSSCTCIMVMVIGDFIFCANSGDSKAILCREKSAYMLSQDLNTSNPQELERIIKVANQFQIDKTLLVQIGPTRAFGRIELKNLKTPGHAHTVTRTSLVISKPEIRVTKIDFSRDEFILLGSDGLFSVMSPQEAVQFVESRLGAMPIAQQDAQRVTDELVNQAIELKANGNVSAILVCLTRGVVRVGHSGET